MRTVDVGNEQILRYATASYAVALALHTADHLHRGVSLLTAQVLWLGNVSTAAGLVTVALVFMRHRRAPLAAAALGIPTALGVAAVHLLPTWSAFSDAFPGAHHTGVTAVSWFVVLLEIAGATAMGVAGIATMRHQRELAPHPVR
jgi:hypothetical protein